MKTSFLRPVLAAVAAVALLTGTSLAHAAELNTEVMLSSSMKVRTEVTVGENPFDIHVWASGNLPAEKTGEFTVTTVYNMAADGTITPDDSQFVTLHLTPGHNYSSSSYCYTAPIPLGCASNPFVISAKVVVPQGTAGGTLGTVVADLTGSQGATADPTPDKGYVQVAAGVVNQAPVVSSAAADANGDEGDTLATSGAFTDPDGNPLSITLVQGDGAIVDNGDGTWSWSLPTSDNGSGTVVVEASDGELTVTDAFDWSAVNVAPLVQNPALTRLDACSVDVSAAFSDKGTADTHTALISWGDETSTTIDPATSPVTGQHTYTSNGTKTIEITVTDDDGASGSSTASFATLNTASALKQPINASGTPSVFKLGSTIPLKITVSDCAGQQVSTLTPSVSLYKLDSTTGALITEPVISEVATNGKDMRWSDTQYIYNLSTKLSQFTNAPLTAGSYQVVINDPSFYAPVSATFDLKK